MTHLWVYSWTLTLTATSIWPNWVQIIEVTLYINSQLVNIFAGCACNYSRHWRWPCTCAPVTLVFNNYRCIHCSLYYFIFPGMGCFSSSNQTFLTIILYYCIVHMMNQLYKIFGWVGTQMNSWKKSCYYIETTIEWQVACPCRRQYVKMRQI